MLLVSIIAFWLTMAAGIVDKATNQNPNYWLSDFPDWSRFLIWAIPALFAIYTLFSFKLSALTITLLFIGPGLRVVNYTAAEAAWQYDGTGVENSWFLACLYFSMSLFVVAASFLLRNDRAVRLGII